MSDIELDDWNFPTLDQASTDLANQLAKRYEQRLAIQKRLLDGLSPKGRFRRNALCPCGSGKKFKKCHYRDFMNKKNGVVEPSQSEKEPTE